VSGAAHRVRLSSGMAPVGYELRMDGSDRNWGVKEAVRRAWVTRWSSVMHHRGVRIHDTIPTIARSSKARICPGSSPHFVRPQTS
jgi:hypothetical protein